MTRVAFQVDQLWFTQPGGIAAYVRGLAPAIASSGEGFDVTLFHARFGAAVDEPWMSAMRERDLGRGIRTLYPSWALLGRPRLPRDLAGHDVIHATSPVGIPPTPRGAAAVTTVHDVAFRRFPHLYPRRWRLLHERGLRRAARGDAVLVPSAAVAEDLRALGEVDPSRVHVTPLASSLPIGDVEPAAVTARLGVTGPYLLFVGTLEPRKGIPTLVRAFRRIAARVPHTLVLAGPSGWQDAEIRNELADGPERIVVTGAISGGQLDALYRGADAFSYPSISEGFGLPVLEAMERGIPVITSDAPALVEVAGGAAASSPVGDEAAAFTWPATARATIDGYRAALARVRR